MKLTQSVTLVINASNVSIDMNLTNWMSWGMPGMHVNFHETNQVNKLGDAGRASHYISLTNSASFLTSAVLQATRHLIKKINNDNNNINNNNNNNNNNNEHISRVPFHVKHAQLRRTDLCKYENAKCMHRL